MQKAGLLSSKRKVASFAATRTNRSKTALDKTLVNRNKAIEKDLLQKADVYYKKEDFRWFFTYAHAKITQQINRNIRKFQRPNALMEFNIHFAEAFINAIDGQPHQEWKKAFQYCKALENNSDKNILLIGEIEFCGARMANVHINVDIRKTLEEVGCIPQQDYANMLIFINRGSLAALKRLRGRFWGSWEAIFDKLVVSKVTNLNVTQWRNVAYQMVCKKPVSNPSRSFLSW